MTTKKERTIRSETTKVFLVIFTILLVVGIFTVFSTFRGANTFTRMQDVHLKQFRAAEIMKQRALDIIAIYYVLSSDQDQDLLMAQLQRYDGLIASFDESLSNLKTSISEGEKTADQEKLLTDAVAIKTMFDALNENCRRMTFALMEKKKDEGAKYFALVDADIKKFKEQVDQLEAVVISRLDNESSKAQSLLANTTWLGLFISIAAIFITLGLIYYLMKFLSISLLPISNLMHNMRQAVFSIDSSLKTISPASNYSSVVFGEDIIGKNLNDFAYKDIARNSETYASANGALTSVFGEDDLQWMLAEDNLPGQVKRKIQSENGESQEKILKLSYTPLWDKQQKVQSIMVVAEDVTEIEKLREEALEKQGELGIIQGLIGISRADAEAFLDESQLQLRQSRDILRSPNPDTGARELLFRILHTMKGNSRMYGMNAISEAVHITENHTVEMNTAIAAKDPQCQELREKVLAGLESVEWALAAHSRMAHKIFGIQDKFMAHREEKLHQCVADLEVALAVPESQESQRLDKIIDKTIILTRNFEDESLLQALNEAKSTIGREVSHKTHALNEISHHYKQLVLQNGLLKPCNSDPAKWISLFQGIVSLTRSFETWNKNERSSS